jgi:dolichyl-diphosphooligosaccharide--protein glycosyltransferase
MLAILPGEFFGRTILGNTDRDAFEVMLSALTMLFLILAVKSAREKNLTFGSLKNLSHFYRPVIYSLVLGIILGIFVLTWRGSFIFILIILSYFVVQTVIDQFKKRSSQYLGLVVIIALLISLIVFLTGSRIRLVMAALTLSLISVVILTALASIMAAKKARPLFYLLTIVAIGLLGLGIFYAASPSLFKETLNQFSVFFPSGANLTVSQMQPILFPSGNFSLIPVWGNYTTGVFLIFVSLGMLIYIIIKRDEPDKVLLLVWSLIVLAATLLTRRIALLFALNVALLLGFFAWQIIGFMLNKTSRIAPVPVLETVSRAVKKKKVRENEPRRMRQAFLPKNRIAVLAITGIAVFFLVYFPDINPAVSEASQYPAFSVPSDNWYQALTWLKDNTPEPLGNPAAYYNNYAQPIPYPDSAYGIAAWWDFGYWIIRIGHRMPVSDPGAGAREQVAKLFMAQNETTGNEIMNGLNMRYVIIDDTTVGSKIGGVASYAGISLAQLGETYYTRNAGKLTQVICYYPAYYQSLAVRLYRFDGKQVAPTSTTVISYQERVSQEGIAYKEIVTTNNFSSYGEATAFIAKQKTGNYKIIGNSTSQSPVPLESLQHYKEVYSTNPQEPTAVKIFEYTK